ncbi:TetR/AcrR family transcriptional regulator [Amycolatopsis rhabdoformis]|uniref:TetR/AcrR family transcriptional regulator n=1 Tax=Amycolatopsis rhabdoformis TaxID=1448059 RepID=A0ABZ1IE05_9PSEU|nr:TetR/AcrR family transcriptional regulator [Amycolatopsis rhabdoformis]WSE32701.1 TetR/AcrR family transcriptional regulator [Amycolatopsis rhabdoformis]
MSSEKPLTARQAAAEQTRRKLLDAALQEFSRRPYLEVTVGDIARTAGVAHGLVSHHFQGKQGAYVAAVTEVHEQLREAEEAELPAAVPDRIRQRFRGFLGFLAEHPDRALNLVLVGGRDEVFADLRDRNLRVLAGLLGLDPDNHALAAALRSFADAAERLTADWLRAERPFELEALVAAFCALLAGALRAAHELDPALDVTRALTLL